MFLKLLVDPSLGVGKSSVAVNLSIALGRLCGPRKVVH